MLEPAAQDVEVVPSVGGDEFLIGEGFTVLLHGCLPGLVVQRCGICQGSVQVPENCLDGHIKLPCPVFCL